MTDKLTVYNSALMYVEDRKIASLTENSEARRVLDDAWDTTLAICLEQGYWNFAMRAVQADSSASVVPAFGYQYAFTKPEDWVRTYALSMNEKFNPPLDRFNDEAGYWYADCDPLWARYVSSDTGYGLDLSLWTETFTEYVSLRLARRICMRLSGSDTLLKTLIELEAKAKKDALAKDAMNEGRLMPPTGSWARSRTWSSSNRSRSNGTILS